MLMRTSIAVKILRVRFSNAHGSEHITISATSIALRAGETADIHISSLCKLTFGGETSITIAAGAGKKVDRAEVGGQIALLE